MTTMAPERGYDPTASLLALQAPVGVPRSTALSTATDPVIPPQRSQDALAHFFPALYDLSPESSLSRLLKVLLGDAGVGQLRKRYLTARMQQVVLTTRYRDLDRLYSTLFGLDRLSFERLDAAAYYEAATPAEWDRLDSRDASYRSRVEQFSRALLLGPTPEGMASVAQAMLGVQCRVYEAYQLVDEQAGTDPTVTPAATTSPRRTYLDVEVQLGRYSKMEGSSYADVEGGTGLSGATTVTLGRSPARNRSEFVVRPFRSITLEENYQLVRVLSRLKPAGALLTIDPRGVGVHRRAPLRAVHADSTYWEVEVKVAPRPGTERCYPRKPARRGDPCEQPRPAASAYQGEAWSYNSDVKSVRSYCLGPGGEVTSTSCDQHVLRPSGQVVRYGPDKALADPAQLLLGRSASDGVLVSSPYAGERRQGRGRDDE